MHSPSLEQRDMHTVSEIPVGCDLDAGGVQRALELRNDIPVRARMQEERCEVLARRQLDMPIAEVRDQTG